MTNVGVDTYRLSYAEKTGGNYQGLQFKNKIANISNTSSCRDNCISSIGCQTWLYNSNNECYISYNDPGEFIETPSFPNNTSGIVTNSRLPDPVLTAFWAMFTFFILLLLFWLSIKKGGVVALTGKVPYFKDGKFHTFVPLDKLIL